MDSKNSYIDVALTFMIIALYHEHCLHLIERNKEKLVITT